MEVVRSGPNKTGGPDSGRENCPRAHTNILDTQNLAAFRMELVIAFWDGFAVDRANLARAISSPCHHWKTRLAYDVGSDVEAVAHLPDLFWRRDGFEPTFSFYSFMGRSVVTCGLIVRRFGILHSHS
jgi:hypothetical protein